MRCEHCGAIIPAGAFGCPYCRAPTRFGFEEQQRQSQFNQQRAFYQDQQQRAGVDRQLASTSIYGLVFSIIGVFVCCTPLSIVAVVQGLRARGMAARLGVPAPGSALGALVLGGLGVLTSIGFFTFAFVRSSYVQEETNERIAELDKQTSGKLTAATIDHRSACAISEMYTLRTGFDHQSGSEMEAFECNGKLTLDATRDTAQLEDFRFRYQSSTSYDVYACMKRGAKWYVTELRTSACPR